MIIIVLNTMLSECLFFAPLFLLLLVTDECFMAPRPLTHGLDAVMGPSYSRKAAF